MPEDHSTKVYCMAVDCRWNSQRMCVLDRILLAQEEKGKLICQNYAEKPMGPEDKPATDQVKYQDPKIDVIIAALPQVMGTKR